MGRGVLFDSRIGLLIISVTFTSLLYVQSAASDTYNTSDDMPVPNQLIAESGVGIPVLIMYSPNVTENEKTLGAKSIGVLASTVSCKFHSGCAYDPFGNVCNPMSFPYPDKCNFFCHPLLDCTPSCSKMLYNCNSEQDNGYTYTHSGSSATCASTWPKYAKEADYVKTCTCGCTGDSPYECGGTCWGKCNDPNYPHWNCKGNGEATCCQNGYPYWCDRTSNCWPQSCQCNKAVNCGSGWRACNNCDDVTTCDGTTLRCCPSGSPYWCGLTSSCVTSGNACCMNDCSSSGSTRCIDSSNQQTCGNYDSDTCLEWGNTQYCQYGCIGSSCKTCITHSSYSCYSGNVWWYDSCGNREDMKQGCDFGCSGSSCCSPACGPNSKPSGCGSDGWVGNPWCQDGNVWQAWRINKCNNPDSCSASCSYSDENRKKTDCVYGCSNGVCVSCKSDGTACSASTECCSGICNSNSKCGKQADGQPCGSGAECQSSRCVHSICRPTDPYCGDGYCDPGETHGSCPNDCKCTIPDGSSWGCDCDSDVDCPSGYYCKQVDGPDGCMIKPCTDECMRYDKFFCKNGDVFKCANYDADPCYEEKLIDVCGPNEYCNADTNPTDFNCRQMSQPITFNIEEAEEGVGVYKQPGDIVKLKIYSPISQDVDFSFDITAFTLTSGNCRNGKASFVRGSNVCKFSISEDAASGTYSFIAGKKTALLKVTKSPQMLIITQKEKLYDRFSYDKSGVDSLLSSAYKKAELERGVVYDLNDYISENEPFSAYYSYSENPLTPSMRNNLYSYLVALFTQKKCGSCKNTIVLGDDYVVPFYRADYADIKGWNFWLFWINKHPEVSYIYTDNPYIPEKKLYVSDVDKIFYNTDVIVVRPDTVSSDIRIAIDEFKDLLVANGYITNSQFKEIVSSDIGCNSYGELGDASLILIGDRNSNNAIKCTPWFNIEQASGDAFDAAISVERNVWGNSKYALVFSGDTKIALKNLGQILENPQYYKNTFMKDTSTIYMTEVSNPPVNVGYGKIIAGYALGTCEGVGDSLEAQGSCMASDIVLSVAPITSVITDIRDMILYCPSAILGENGQRETLTTLVCSFSAGGAAVPIIGYLAGGVGAIPATVPDTIMAGLKRVTKTIKIATKSNAEKIFKHLDKVKFFDLTGNLKFLKVVDETDDLYSLVGKITSGKKNVGEVVDSINNGIKRSHALFQGENARIWAKISNTFAEDNTAKVLKNIDDYEHMTNGARQVLKTTKTLTNLPFSAVDNIDVLRTIGKAENSFGISKDLLDGVEFTASVDSGFSPVTRRIYLNYLKETPQEIKILVVFHEFGHVKVFDVVGDAAGIVNTIPAGENNRIIAKSLEWFEELTADSTARKFITDYDWKNYLKSEAQTVQQMIDKLDAKKFDEFAYMWALAKKTGDSQSLGIIEGALRNTDKETQVIDLGRKFLDNADIISKSKVARDAALNDIAKSTYDLMDGFPGE